MPNHKSRGPTDRDLTFRAPRHACFACNDTGIVVNGDGALHSWVPDYDLVNGRQTGGHDLALICHCKATRPERGPDGATVRQGLRDDSGRILTVETEQGPRAVGVEIPVEWCRALHERRRETWAVVEAEISRYRQARAAGQPVEEPWYLTEARTTVQRLLALATAEAKAADEARKAAKAAQHEAARAAAAEISAAVAERKQTL